MARGTHQRLAQGLFGDRCEPLGDGARFAEIAQEKGYLSAEQVAKARAGATDRWLGHVLLKDGLLSGEQFLEIAVLLHQEETATAPSDERIGRYLLRRQVGQGGMAVVYEAEDPELHRPVALKVVREDRADRETLLRFQREATLAAQLQHPNIVAIHEVGVARNREGRLTHYIAMDYVPGDTMAGLLERRDRGRDDLLRMLEEVAGAVGFAHSKGIVHRDLKPSNVLIDASGRAILTDFGLAHAESSVSRLTQSNTLLGTPQYMAPEQVEGKVRAIDARTDVFALGVILYEILAGRLPFQGNNPAELFRQILEREPIPPGRLRGSVDRDLDLICLKALEKDRARRYADGADFAEDLARRRKGESIQARRPSWFYRVRKRLAKRRGVLAAMAAVLLVAAGGTSWAVVRLIRGSAFRESRARAEAAYATGDWARALAESERALDLRPDAAMIRIRDDCGNRLARGWERSRLRDEKVLPLLRKVRETEPYFYIPDIDLGEKLAEVERALSELEEIAHLPACEELVDLWVALGSGRYLLSDCAEAEAALRKAGRADPGNSEANILLAKVFMRRVLESSLESEETPEKKDEASRFWIEKVAEYARKAAAAGGEKSEINATLVRAYLALAGRDRKAEIAICRDGLRRFGDRLGTEEFWLLLALTTTGKEREEALDSAIRRMPHHFWARLVRGRDREKARQWKEAIADYSEAIRVNRRHATAHHFRARARLNDGDVQGALSDYDQAVALRPETARYYGDRGQARLRAGDAQGAVDDCTRSIELDPRNCVVYHRRGAAYAKLGKLDDAVRDFDKAVEISPDDVSHRENRGATYFNLRRWKEAIRDFEEVLAKAPPEWPDRAQVADWLLIARRKLVESGPEK